MTKITKKEMYAAIKEAFETGACKFDKDTVIAFCDKEITALDNKAAKAKERAATKKAEADVLYDQVADALNTEEFQTIADIAAAVAEVKAEQAAQAKYERLTKLVEAGVAEKTDVTIPGGEGVKARKVKAFRKLA